MNDGGMNQGFALREQCGRRQRERGHGHGVLYLSMARLPVKERVFCEGNTCCEWAEIAVKHREIPFSFKFVQTRLPLDRQACAKLVGAPAAPPTGNMRQVAWSDIHKTQKGSSTCSKTNGSHI